MKHRCDVCTRNFASKKDLSNHINKRQNPCSRPTQFCETCDKGFSSPQSLWNHKVKCKSQANTDVKDGSNMVSYIDKIINQCSPRSSIKLPLCDSPPREAPSSPPVEKLIEKPKEKSPPKPVPTKETTPPPVLFSVLPKPPH